MLARIRRLLSRPERGTSTLEVAAWGVPMALFLVLMGASVRMMTAEQAVQSAAASAARAASFESTDAAAADAARDFAHTSLQQSGVECAGMNVTVEAVGLQAAIGTIGRVTAHVSCTVDLARAALVGLPGSRELRASVTVPVDAFRERG